MFIAATGMTSPVGLDSLSACAALRAGISAFSELPYHDRAGERVIGCAVPGLHADFESGERLTELSCAAIAECRAQSEDRWAQVPLLMAMAEPDRPPGQPGADGEIIASVEQKLGIRFDGRFSRVIRRGRASTFLAFHVARQILAGRHRASCLVCGVDSLLNGRTLSWLEQSRRLKTKHNRDGLVPGEAAAAILFQSDPSPISGAVMTEVRGLGFAQEDAHVLNDEPLLGLGLTHATREALHDAGIQLNDIALRVSDVTGEAYGFKEQSLMVARLLRNPVADLPIWHCADSIGDTGAAAGSCQVVVAHCAFMKDYAPGERVACFTSSDLGDRAVAVLAGGSRQGSIY